MTDYGNKALDTRFHEYDKGWIPRLNRRMTNYGKRTILDTRFHEYDKGWIPVSTSMTKDGSPG